MSLIEKLVLRKRSVLFGAIYILYGRQSCEANFYAHNEDDGDRWGILTRSPVANLIYICEARKRQGRYWPLKPKEPHVV